MGTQKQAVVFGLGIWREKWGKNVEKGRQKGRDCRTDIHSDTGLGDSLYMGAVHGIGAEGWWKEHGNEMLLTDPNQSENPDRIPSPQSGKP